MITNQQRFSLISITASALAVWLYIVTQIEPNKDDVLVIVTFFISLVIWLGSALAFLLFLYRVKQGNREVIFAHIMPSIRQGLLVSATVAVLLFLQLLRVISLWDALLVILVACLFEAAMRQSTSGLRK